MKYRIVHTDPHEVMQAYGVQSLTARYLQASGFNAQQIEELLHPLPVQTSQAECVQACARRILQARENGEKVFIGGDYDADGICATAIMKDTLEKLGIPCGYYIPDRYREGYGLQVQTVQQVLERGYQLILTVDNGVQAQDAIEAARQGGAEVIITDHHLRHGPLKDCLLVHPDQMEPEYATLSGAGVALQIARTLIGEDPRQTALAAVAAIGDVMPMWGQNRSIVRAGLQAIRDGRAPALSILLKDPLQVDPMAVTFQIVPKLNSVARLNADANVNTLIPYLLSSSDHLIRGYSGQLEQLNEERKERSRIMAEKAESLCQTDDPFLILCDDSFEEGLNGLVAGRLAEAHQKPVLVFSRHEDLCKGSGRSRGDFNLYEFFAHDFPILQNFGGHAQAVGLSVRQADYSLFCSAVEEKMAGLDYDPKPLPKTALEITPAEISLGQLQQLQTLQPYPQPLGEPLFALRNPVILHRSASPKVIRYRFRTGEDSADAVLFAGRSLKEPPLISLLIGHLGIHVWQGRSTLQLNIESFQD